MRYAAREINNPESEKDSVTLGSREKDNSRSERERHSER